MRVIDLHDISLYEDCYCVLSWMEVACSSKMSAYICQTTWRHMREDVIFFALGISNFVTCSFNFYAEEILTSAQYPGSPLHSTHAHLCTVPRLKSAQYPGSSLHITQAHVCTVPRLTSAHYPGSQTSHSWLSTIDYWICVQPFSIFGARVLNPQPADQKFWQGACAWDVDERMFLKWIVKKWFLKVWAGFI